jgi:hypothetical protein
MMDGKDWFQRWYSSDFIRIEIAKSIGHREVALLDYKDEVPGFRRGYCVRNIHAMSSSFLLKTFEAFKFFDRSSKLYTSLASYKHLPNFSYAFKIRAQEQKIWGEAIVKDPGAHIEGMDFLLDLDSKTFDAGHKQAKIVFDLLLNHDAPFIVLPSAGKAGGFHFRIRWEKIREAGIAWNDVLRFSYLSCLALKYRFEMPDVDCGLFDLRRVAKAPYSLVYGANKRWNVCLPLAEKQFLNYVEGQNEVSLVWKMEQLKFRGLCEIGNSPKGIKSFFDELVPIGLEVEKELNEAKNNKGELP